MEYKLLTEEFYGCITPTIPTTHTTEYTTPDSLSWNSIGMSQIKKLDYIYPKDDKPVKQSKGRTLTQNSCASRKPGQTRKV